MYELVGIFGESGAGKDTAARYITKHLPGWQIGTVSTPLLREYERRHNLVTGTLDNYHEKARLRSEIGQLASEILAVQPQWLIEECLALPRPVIIVGARPLIHLLPLQNNGALMIEVKTDRAVRIARIGEEAVLRADQDPFEQEMLTYTGERIYLDNNGSLESLEMTLLERIIPLLKSA